MKNKTDTQDIYFTAALMSLGAKLDYTDKTDPRHMKFFLTLQSFESKSIQDAVNVNQVDAHAGIDIDYYENEWANGTLLVNAVKFKDALQRLKSVIHSS